MAENFNLIFGSQAPETASWSDADYQTGWNVVGSTPPTAEQFDALQNRSDKKSQELNNRLSPLEQKAQEQGRQAGTAYAVGAAVTVAGLPADWLLICTTAGISGTVAITLPNPLLDGATINDGAITWTLRKIATNGSLGYRQPSTAYSAGQIAYHSALPTGWYLECTTAGTSGSGDLTISSPSIGGTVTDGTVTWKIGMALSVNGGTMYGNDIRRGVANSLLALFGGNAANNAAMQLYGGDNTTKAGNFELIAASGNSGCSLTGKPTGGLTWDDNDLGGSAIVAKSLGINGYIKYASGLIMQWFESGVGNKQTSGTVVGFPITFSGTNYQLAAINAADGYVSLISKNPFNVTLRTSINNTGSSACHMIAIGY